MTAYGITVHTEEEGGDVRFGRFRHKGLKALHEDDNAKGVPGALSDRLRKLLFALETADNLDQVRRFPGWNLHPLKGAEGRLERTNTADDIDLIDYH